MSPGTIHARSGCRRSLDLHQQTVSSRSAHHVCVVLRDAVVEHEVRQASWERQVDMPHLPTLCARAAPPANTFTLVLIIHVR